MAYDRRMSGGKYVTKISIERSAKGVNTTEFTAADPVTTNGIHKGFDNVAFESNEPKLRVKDGTTGDNNSVPLRGILRNSAISQDSLKIPSDVAPAKTDSIYGWRHSVTQSSTKRKRETWGSKLEFLLAVIGFAVDLGNVWRFPYICYKNGGGAFLIAYAIMFAFLALPLFYLELAVGQYFRSGAITVWKYICPMFAGIGYGIVLIGFFVGSYYNTVIAYSAFFLIESFQSEVPWKTCNHTWNTPLCNDNVSHTVIGSSSPTEEFFERYILESHKSTGIGNIGGIKWQIAVLLLGVFIIYFIALCKGIKISGKCVYVTATLPYILLIVLLVRGATLPGAKDGIEHFLKPDFEKLKDTQVWVDAAGQIFFSLGPGFGVLLALSSYNKFNNNLYFDAIVTSIINSLTSLLAGFVVFSVIGNLAFIKGENVRNVTTDGPGLIFVAYPQALAMLEGSVVWSILFFIMVILLGLDSSFGGFESVFTALCDRFETLKRYRPLMVFVFLSMVYAVGLSTTTYGGQYVSYLLDFHAAPSALIFMCCMEVIAIVWIYGVNNISDNIESMLGFRPGLFWLGCWIFVGPVGLALLFVLSLVQYPGLKLGPHIFPDWAEGIGWAITCSSIICVPLYMIYMFITTPGTLRQRLHRMVKLREPYMPNIQEDLEKHFPKRASSRFSRFRWTK